MNPAQPPQPRPANHPHEHSLRLIIERVPGYDLVESSAAEGAPQSRESKQYRGRAALQGRGKAPPRNRGFSPWGSTSVFTER